LSESLRRLHVMTSGQVLSPSSLAVKRFNFLTKRDAQRLLAEADDPASVKQAILMALCGGHPGTQQGLIGRKAAQHCQIWVPTELTPAVPDLTAKPSVYWLCDTHQGQVSNDDIVARLAQQRRGGTGAR
jgi:hypothetical protein